ncbi:hypothetical protein D3C85_1859880 [compost metagenome]
MQHNAPLTAIGGYCFKLRIFRQLSANLALRQLQQEAGYPLAHVHHIFECNQTVLPRQQQRLQMMQLF